MTFSDHWENAISVIGQIERGEWVPRYNPIARHHITAHRDGKQLWLSNGSWFCDVNDSNAFGLILRHYVYFMAARKLKIDADREMKVKKEIHLWKN